MALGQKIKYFKNSIKNLIKWFPIIWQDRDWDHGYVEDMLLFKLNNMYKRFSDPNATYVDWNSKHAKPALKALKICIQILERRKNNYYTDYWWNRGQEDKDINKKKIRDKMKFVFAFIIAKKENNTKHINKI